MISRRCSRRACRLPRRRRRSRVPSRCCRWIRRWGAAMPRRPRSAASSRPPTPGPLRHRYGAARDLVVGMTVALSDGTIARSGGKVIKNVAGYDIAKLFSGAFGTLGAILEVSVRLHPLAPASSTALGASDDPERAREGRAAADDGPARARGARRRLAIRLGAGARAAGRRGGSQARSCASTALMREAGLEDVDAISDDDDLWSRQRAGQRSEGAVLARVAARPSALAQLVRATRSCEGRLVGRAALGLSWIEVEPEALAALRDAARRAGDDRRARRPAGNPRRPRSVGRARRSGARADAPDQDAL